MFGLSKIMIGVMLAMGIALAGSLWAVKALHSKATTLEANQKVLIDSNEHTAALNDELHRQYLALDLLYLDAQQGRAAAISEINAVNETISALEGKNEEIHTYLDRTMPHDLFIILRDSTRGDETDDNEGAGTTITD